MHAQYIHNASVCMCVAAVIPPRVLHFSANEFYLPIRDNLRIRDSGLCTKVSLNKRFHCTEVLLACVCG